MTRASDGLTRSRVRVIGLGNPLRGDDAVGLHVADRVRQLLGTEGDVITAELAGIHVLERLEGYALALLVDAARTGAEAGTIHRWDLEKRPLLQHPGSPSTHALNALDAIELARALGAELPRIVLYGIEIDRAELGAGLSEPVARAVETAATRISQEARGVIHA